MKHENKQLTIDVRNLIDESLQSYKVNPVDLLNIGDAEGEYHYLLSHENEYERTVQDVVGYLPNTNRSSIKILEIGSFLGLVSIVLSRLNFNVTATDIEEFISCPRLQLKLKEFNVKWKSCNLRSNKLPFNNDEYDVVIMCETLEHLNFNPLPVIDEINRVLKPNGLLYLTSTSQG
jgi:2-polyprenyl-3-methyl-5-hydroxy-6-metoxy-1,4-benzoquinol methylase